MTSYFTDKGAPMKFSPSNEPAAWSGALIAILNVLVVLNVVALDADQIAGINVALVAVFAVVVRQSVTPNGRL